MRINTTDPESSLAAARDAIVRAVLRAADPSGAVRRAKFPDTFHPTALLATGKAAAPMVESALARTGESMRTGAVTCLPAHENRLRAALKDHPGITIHPADHPLATGRNLAAAAAIATAAKAISRMQADTLILISGGASAHLTSPAPGLTLEDLRNTTQALLLAGATINQLNTVRKHCETLKGGRLAALLCPARAHALVLSDVLGDPLDTIGSGPTAPDPTTFADAAAVVDEFPDAPIPEAVRVHISRAADETPKPGSASVASLSHAIIANNTEARHAAERAAESVGFPVAVSQGLVSGEASVVAADLVRTLAAVKPPGCVVFAGETTVTVGAGTGRGGRNQELAVAAAMALETIPNAALLTLATDGIDGPTDAAGAFVTSRTASDLRRVGIDPADALARHDSHTALDRVGALIRTGPTGSNINDVAVAIRTA